MFSCLRAIPFGRLHNNKPQEESARKDASEILVIIRRTAALKKKLLVVFILFLFPRRNQAPLCLGYLLSAPKITSLFHWYLCIFIQWTDNFRLLFFLRWSWRMYFVIILYWFEQENRNRMVKKEQKTHYRTKTRNKTQELSTTAQNMYIYQWIIIM